MPRGVGEAAIVSELPEWVVAVAGLVTQLGDMWFVLAAIVAVYWLGERGTLRVAHPLRDSLFLLALATGGYALTVVLKHAFGLPRPPGATTAAVPPWLPVVADPVYESLVTADGFGFPSGHAVKATAVFGGAALVFEVGERRRRLAVAAVSIALVALSRVVLGVHYVVDIVAGVAVGLVFLAAMVRFASHRPERALGCAGVLGVVAAATSVTVNAGLTVVAALAGIAIWRIFDDAGVLYVPRDTR